MNQHIIFIDIYIYIIITIIVIHDHKDYYDNIIFTIFIIISYRYYFAIIIVYSPKNYEMKGGCMYSPAFFGAETLPKRSTNQPGIGCREHVLNLGMFEHI